MVSLPPDGLEMIATQLELLNMLILVYLICKGVVFAGAVLARRNPPTKSIRPKLAQSSES